MFGSTWLVTSSTIKAAFGISEIGQANHIFVKPNSLRKVTGNDRNLSYF